MNQVLVFGKDGQVGRALCGLLGLKVRALGREKADFLRPEGLRDIVRQVRPSAIINAAAYTAVDRAEDEETKAFTINAEAPLVLAEECKVLGIPLVHYSTDYVFNGTGQRPWMEEDPPAPLNLYGQSKRAGEEAICRVGGDFLIFRTSWVYDVPGRNFLTTMLRLGAERERLEVVSDQIGAPTYALHLADRTLGALTHAMSRPRFPSGIYHLANAGETSWHDFAKSIFTYARQMGCPLKVAEVKPIPSSSYPTPARRPLNSRLDCTKAQGVLGVTMPHWEVGLREAIRARFRFGIDPATVSAGVTAPPPA
jgi:dTDP-4-dehydrorhamnose reductase